MNNLQRDIPRAPHVSAPSSDEFATTSWREQSRSRLSAAYTLLRLAILDYPAQAGFGLPRSHLHRNDEEIFLIQSGAITLWTPELCRIAGPSDVVFLPKQMPHAWRAYGDSAVHFQMTVTPGEFESFFQRIAGSDSRRIELDQRDGLCPRPPARLRRMGGRRLGRLGIVSGDKESLMQWRPSGWRSRREGRPRDQEQQVHPSPCQSPSAARAMSPSAPVMGLPGFYPLQSLRHAALKA